AQQSYTIGANDQLTAANEYKSIVVAYRNGAPVLVKDVANVVAGLENSKVAGWYKGHPAVIIDVQRQPGANVIETVQRAKVELAKLQKVLPAGIDTSIVNDETGTIRASINDVQFTLMLSVALVVMVVLLFLRTIRATIIAGVALPLSIVATFGVMYFCGFSIDNLSLMALTIGTGFVVDDAIVMIENIVRHIEEGEAPLTAALKGAREIGFTVISLTFSLIAVFIPLIFMTGLVGRMFREFALTLTIAVVTSAIVSLTLTPMMCGHILRGSRQHASPQEEAHKRRFGFEWILERVIRGYGASLEWSLRHRPLMLVLTGLTLATTVWLYIVIPKGFLPLQDTGVITATTRAAADISFDQLRQVQEGLADRLRADPDVTAVTSVVGVGAINDTPN
ncbi:MAG: efflux RND transporter permease subunit, partial [Bradyrhizobium sp.]